MTYLLADRPFLAYGPSHLSVLALFVIGIPVLVVLGRRQRGSAAALRSSRAFAAVMVVALVPLQISSMRPGRFDIDYSLPLQLSDMSWFAAVAALWTHARWACALTYYWGLTLTTQALITPALEGPDFPSEQFIAFWALHLLVVWAAVYLTWGLGLSPDWRSFRVAVAVTLGWGLTIFAFNTVAGTNYGYLNAKPATGSLLDMLGDWPWYLASELVLGVSVWAAMTWPWTRRRTPTWSTS